MPSTLTTTVRAGGSAAAGLAGAAATAIAHRSAKLTVKIPPMRNMLPPAR